MRRADDGAPTASSAPTPQAEDGRSVGRASDGRWRTSIAVACKNECGSLFKALSCFALRDINLSRIFSRPTATTRGLLPSAYPLYHWNYVHYLEVDASISDAKMAAALAQLREFSHAVRVMGCYRGQEEDGTKMREAERRFNDVWAVMCSTVA
jgi:prephenate dehydratase